MNCIGNGLLCVTAVNVCSSEIYCVVLKLSAAWDKGEGLRYSRWKILHSRWAVVLQLEWSVLQ